jgi:hypothetical protein
LRFGPPNAAMENSKPSALYPRSATIMPPMSDLWKALAVLIQCAAFTAAAAADDVPFRIRVKEAARQPAPGLQSFSYAVHEGKWLLVGGRTNGFHRTSDRESTFPTRLANSYLYVIDPVKDAAWKVAIPAPFRDQLRATNATYYQDGDVLYVIGGYGATVDDDRPESYQTFPTLTAIRVPEIVKAIVEGRQSDVAAQIVSVNEDRMRVAGGELKKLGDRFYLCFGQNYDSIYNSAYTCKYTGDVRRFTIATAGGRPSIGDYAAFGDPMGGSPDSQYHRRDLVVTEAVRPDGALGLMGLGGVFTRTAGSWVNPIHIDHDAAGKTTLTVDHAFDQNMS